MEIGVGRNTIIETAIEDGVEMVTTYTDEDGELLVKHYCALGTEPVFLVVESSDSVVELAFDENRSPLRPHTHDYVDSMKWTMDQDDADAMVYEYVATLSGERSSNRAELREADLSNCFARNLKSAGSWNSSGRQTVLFCIRTVPIKPLANYGWNVSSSINSSTPPVILSLLMASAVTGSLKMRINSSGSLVSKTAITLFPSVDPICATLIF